MRVWIERGVTRADDRDGRTTRVHRGRVGRTIDPDSQAGNHGRPDADEGRRQPRCDGAASVARSSSADDRDRRPRIQHSGIAEDEQQVWRHLDGAEPAGIARVLDRHDGQAQLPDPGQRSARSVSGVGDPAADRRTDRAVACRTSARLLIHTGRHETCPATR